MIVINKLCDVMISAGNNYTIKLKWMVGNKYVLIVK